VKLRSIASRRFISRAAIAGLALVALPLTTSCQTRIGLAASVGGTQIDTSQLTAVTARSAAALAATGQTVPANQQPALQRGVLNLLVRDALLEEIGKAQGLSATPSQLAIERASEARQAGGDKALITQSEQGGVSAADLDIVVREKLLITKLQSKFGSSDSTTFANKLTAAAQKIKVRVNPRFGQWDAKNLTIVGAPNDLSSTVTKK
jgi:SurA N-terminal domain